MAKSEWTKERLQALVGEEESLKLEFKSSRALTVADSKASAFIDDLTTHVSAFLNTGGGVIVVGMEETRDDPKRAEKASALSEGVPRSVMVGSRLENMVCSRINPTVASYVRVLPVVVDVRDGVDLLAFVIEVREGVTAYQAADKRYYGRRSFASIPLEDKDIRLRMLADDRPRVDASVRIEAFPAGTNWESWEAARKANAAAKRDWLRRTESFRDKDYDSMTDEERRALAEVPTLWDSQGRGSVEARLTLTLHNIGIVTVRRVAIRHAVALPSDLADSLSMSGEGQALFERRFDEYDQLPLYPDMAADATTWQFFLTPGMNLPEAGIPMGITVYLDGGQPAEVDVDLAGLFREALEEYEVRRSNLMASIKSSTDTLP